MKRNYEVVVGNIGTVYSGANRNAARKVYAIYIQESRGKYGRASGEPVTLIQDGEIIAEYAGTVDSDVKGREANPFNDRKARVKLPRDWSVSR